MKRPIYFAYLRTHIIGLLYFKLDFLIGVAASLFETALSMVFLIVVFSYVNMLAGVPFSEILLMFSFGNLGRAIHLLFFDNLWVIGSKFIQQGELDRALVRPRNLLFQIVAERINIQGFGQVAVGSVAIAWALSIQEEVIPAVSYALIPLLLLASGAVFVLVHICLASLSFWVVDSSGVTSTVFAAASFGQYPLEIFSVAISWVLITVLPFAFTGYVPAGLLTGSLGFGWAVTLVVILLVLGAVASTLWGRGVASYTSTGN